MNGWERYAAAGISTKSFGESLPGAAAYGYIGFEPQVKVPKMEALLDEVRREGVESLRGDFTKLNGTMGLGFRH